MGSDIVYSNMKVLAQGRISVNGDKLFWTAMK